MVLKSNDNQGGGFNRFLNKYLKFIKVLLFLIILALGYLLIINSKLSDIRSQQQAIIDEKSESLAGMQDTLKKLENLKKIKMDFENSHLSNLQKLNEILPPDSEKYNLIAQIEALVKSYGFSFSALAITENLQPQLVEAPEGTAQLDLPSDSGLKTININFSVSGGDYPIFKEFLTNLQKHIRLFDISSIAFSNPTEEKNTYTTSIIKILLTLTIFLLLVNTKYFKLRFW